jgi:hypothetical protein
MLAVSLVVAVACLATIIPIFLVFATIPRRPR